MNSGIGIAPIIYAVAHVCNDRGKGYVEAVFSHSIGAFLHKYSC